MITKHATLAGLDVRSAKPQIELHANGPVVVEPDLAIVWDRDLGFPFSFALFPVE